MLRRWCRSVVRGFGPSWGKIGWVLFLFRLWLPGLFERSSYYEAVVGSLNALLSCWWLIDATENAARKTAVKIGILIVLCCLMPHISLPLILLWLFYWVYLRD